MREIGIKKVFKNFFPQQEVNKIIKMITSPNNYFSTWSGTAFEYDIVKAAIRPKANAIGKMQLRHIIKNENISIPYNPQVNEILTYPNKYMTMQDMLEKLTFQRELNHNAFAYVDRDTKGNVIGIYPVTYSAAELIEQEGFVFIKFYLLSGKYMVVNYDDVIHLRKDFNRYEFFGESGEKATNNLIEVLNSTDQSMISAVKNSAVIKWILKYAAILKKEDKEENVKDFVKNYLSSESAGTGVAVSDGRYDLVQVKNESYVPNAAQTKEITQRIYSLYGVNTAIVQNSYTEDQWNSFYESEIEPPAIKISLSFTKVFFTKKDRANGDKIIAEASNLAYASMSTKLGLVAMVDRGSMLPNEHRAILNLPPIEGGDKPLRRLDTAQVEDSTSNIELSSRLNKLMGMLQKNTVDIKEITELYGGDNE